MGKLLGEKIRQLRKDKKMTLEELAKKIDAGKSYVWEIENRDDANPSADRLVNIARALDVTVEFLLDDATPQPTSNVFDQAFFRMYERMSEPEKEQLRRVVEALRGAGNVQ